jgi:hypothetical protein
VTRSRKPETGLRRFAVEPAKSLRTAHFAAGQGHGLEGPFVAELRLEIRLLNGPAPVVPKLLLAGVLLGHRLVVALHQANRGCSPIARDIFLPRLPPILAGIVATCDDFPASIQTFDARRSP